MIDLSREPRKQDQDPEDSQIAMLILCVVLWTAIIIGVMSC